MAKRRADEPIDVYLPIPSFLDMAFQILSFFILTYNPHTLEGQLELALPAHGEARAPNEVQVDPTKAPDTDLDLNSEVTVKVSTQHSAEQLGTISAIYVEGVDTKSNEMKDLDALGNYLKTFQNGLKNKDNIKIQADGELKYAFVAEVMDVCCKAGFKNIGFAPPPDLLAK
ncbi:MAG TPA: biopolymer transporter ExbD [Gemmataceae bacterium]|jgi:biopolymer transport protein ExbD|nr:biopolymer transporter ExbD [Gemmataceae bacterium]